MNLQDFLEDFKEYNNSFLKLFTLYQDRNSKINISAIRDEEGIVVKHFLDSVLGNEILDFTGKKVLDLGTGGGFPLLPLAITNPSASFTGLDSVGKKLKVIAEISNSLGLKNLEILNGRAEDLGQNKNFREKFQIVTSRAFAPWSVTLELALPFLETGGFFLAYQTPSVYGEIKEKEEILDTLGGFILETFEFSLPDEAGERLFILIQKQGQTPKKFPRKVGVPRSEPL